MSKEHLTEAFLRVLGRVAPELPAPTREHYFAKPGRAWRFDVAWPEARVAVEIDGGVFIGGRHSGGTGQVDDATKLSTAAALGWRVLHFTTWHLRGARIHQAAELTAAAVTLRGKPCKQTIARTVALAPPALTRRKQSTRKAWETIAKRRTGSKKSSPTSGGR